MTSSKENNKASAMDTESNIYETCVRKFRIISLKKFRGITREYGQTN